MNAVGCSSTILKGLRFITHCVFRDVKFHPRYVWKDGIIGTSRVYKGLEDEHEEKWTGLFIDLIYVCVCSKIAHMLAYCQINFDIIVTTFMFMMVFFLARFFLDEYNVRFENDDLIHRISNLVFFYGLCTMIVNANLEQESSDSGYRRLGSSSGSDRYTCSLNMTYFSGFVDGYLRTRLSFMIRYIFLMIVDKSNKVYHMFILRVWVWIISMALMAVAGYALSGMDSVWVGFAVVLFEGFSFADSGLHSWLKKHNMIMSKTGGLHFPTNYLTAQARMSIFILVVIGEALILVLTPTWDAMTFTNEGYYVILFALILFFSLAYYYFDHVLKGHGEMHVCRRSAVLGKLFFLINGVLGYCLVFISAAFYGLSESFDYEYWDDTSFRMLCIGCFSTTVVMNMMALMHKGILWHFSQGPKEIARVAAHFAVAFIHLGIMWARKSLSPLEAIVIHSLIFSTQMLGEIALSHSEGSVEINPHRERARTVNMLMNYKVNSNITRDDHQKALIAAVAAAEEMNHRTSGTQNGRTTMELLNKIDEAEEGDSVRKGQVATATDDTGAGDGASEEEAREANIPSRKASVRRKTELDHHGHRVSSEDVQLAEQVGERMNESRARSGTRGSIIDALDVMESKNRETRTSSVFDNEGQSEQEIDLEEVLILNEMNGIKRSFVDHYKEAVDIVCERRERARTMRLTAQQQVGGGADGDRRDTAMPKFL